MSESRFPGNVDYMKDDQARRAMLRLIGDDMPYFEPKRVQRGQAAIETLFPIIQGKAYIAGSYAAWACAPKVEWLPGDIDLFCTSREAWDSLYDDLLQIGYSHNSWGKVVYGLSATQSCPLTHDIQLIAPNPEWQSFPRDLMKSFDMDICRAVLLNSEWALADRNVGGTMGKILLINSPLRVLKRMLKYQARGVTFADSEIVKLFKAWDSMTAEQKQIAIEALIPPTEPDTSEDYESAWDEYFFEE